MALNPLFRLVPVMSAVIPLTVYVYRRLRPIMTTTTRKRIALACLVLGPVGVALGRFPLPLGPATRGVALALAYVGHSLSLIVILCAAIALVVDAGRLLHMLAKRLLPSRAPVPPPAAPESTEFGGLTRRDFIERTATWSALALSSTATLYGVSTGRVDRVIEEVSFRLPKLPHTRDGYVIAQISDVHIGQFVGEADLKRAFELLLRARPDLVVMTGDLVDHDPRYIPQLGRLVRALESRVRDGVVIIPGNHDYYAGVDLVLDTVRRAGGKVLRNQGMVVGAPNDGFALLGADDVWNVREGGQGADVHAAMRDVPPDLAHVLLCHNPIYFPEAAPHVDLMLAGHTHGGQIAIDGHPADLILPFGYVRGAYTLGASTLYVNRGFGTAGPPARIGSTPEITRIVLTS
jgi:predicted MPP superfamily phosphohydrolase